MNKNQKVVAYSDLLGFSKLVVEDSSHAEQLLIDFYDLAQKTKMNEEYKCLELFLFSDSLIVQGDDVSKVVNYMCCLYRSALKYCETNPNVMLCRGGIARGEVITQKNCQRPNIPENFIVSPALTHASKMEKLVKGQRLLLSANELEKLETLSHFWNPKINGICYSQPSIKPIELFLKYKHKYKYKYQDVLWARDLVKEYDESKVETAALVNIAAKLFNENQKKPKGILSHYAETLRICMLSYASVLEPFKEEDGELLRSLVQDTLIKYPHESVWLGFLEMVLLSRDAFAFQRDVSVLNFLRVALLSPKWGEICSALERKENLQLSHAVKKLIEVVVNEPI